MRKAGFTLLEIIIAVAIIGIMATAIGPSLFRSSPALSWQAITDELNSVVTYAQHEAIATQVKHCLVFGAQDNQAHSVELHKEAIDPETKKITTQPIDALYDQARYQFPEEIKITHAYYGKQELLEENKNIAECGVMPDGLVQDIMLHLTKTEDGKETKATLHMQSFLGFFVLYEDIHRKPGVSYEES